MVPPRAFLHVSVGATIPWARGAQDPAPALLI